jgi:hypothetical protein
MQLASQAIVVIAQGAPGNATASYDSYATVPHSTASMLIDAIDWASANAGKGNWSHLDASRVAVAGQSCGGLEAYSAGTDKRVSMYGIFNSGGNLTGTVTGAGAKGITKPVFYFLGGTTDIAYSAVSLPFLTLNIIRSGYFCEGCTMLMMQQGTADYAALPAGTPACKGNLPVGHGGTYNEVNGGKIGVAASYFFQWMLRGNVTASQWFTSPTMAVADGWSVVSKDLDKINVTPI